MVSNRFGFAGGSVTFTLIGVNQQAHSWRAQMSGKILISWHINRKCESSSRIRCLHLESEGLSRLQTDPVDFLSVDLKVSFDAASNIPDSSNNSLTAQIRKAISAGTFQERFTLNIGALVAGSMSWKDFATVAVELPVNFSRYPFQLAEWSLSSNVPPGNTNTPGMNDSWKKQNMSQTKRITETFNFILIWKMVTITPCKKKTTLRGLNFHVAATDHKQVCIQNSFVKAHLLTPFHHQYFAVTGGRRVFLPNQNHRRSFSPIRHFPVTKQKLMYLHECQISPSEVCSGDWGGGGGG